MKKLTDLLKETGIELGKVYTAKDRPSFKVNEASLKRFKVYVSGEKEPLILMGKNEKEVKQTAHMMIKNSSVKIRKVVKEGKLNEGFSSKKVDTKIIADRMKKDKSGWWGKSWAKNLLKKYPKTVSARDLDRDMPDYVYGGAISALFKDSD